MVDKLKEQLVEEDNNSSTNNYFINSNIPLEEQLPTLPLIIIIN